MDTTDRGPMGAFEGYGECDTPEPVPATNQAGEVERLKYYPDYIDDPDGLERFRQAVRTNGGHDMAGVNYNSLGRLIDTIERLRRERDAALATQPATSQEGEDHGLGPHAAVVEDGEDGFMSVAIVVGSNVYLSQGGRQLSMSPEQFAEIASHSLAATPTPPTLSEDLREALLNESKDWRHNVYSQQTFAALAQVKAS